MAEAAQLVAAGRESGGAGDPLDLREWLKRVQALGELREVAGAHWKLEIGVISELNVKRPRHPALLFGQIPDYPAGYRVLTCSTSSPARLAATLRLNVKPDHHSLVQALRGKPRLWEEASRSFAPREVAWGPVLENQQSGQEVDVLRFPAPLWHERDGGRYIGTGCAVVTRDLDSDWINVGTYRVMVHGPNRVGLDMVAGKHGHIQYQKYMKAGKPFPVAIVIGADPLLCTIAGIEVPYGLCEYNYIGAILGRPVEVVTLPLTGLPVPAASELVLEGWCHPGDVAPEGPFGEFHGYYSGKQNLAPVVQVERVYHRADPIILGMPPAKPPNDYSYPKAVMRSALLHDALEAAGVPDVRAVWAHEVGGARMLTVVSIKQRYAGHARQAGHVASQCGVGAYLGRYTIVVDDDIDPANLQEVMWAVATRSDPEVDIDIIRGAMGSKNDPLSVAYRRKAPFSSRAIIDACRPFDFLEEFPPVAEASPELRRQVQARWREVLGDE
ncbi:MAG TPA: UbiD family decarboxylase [Limnochordales bacterium]